MAKKPQGIAQREPRISSGVRRLFFVVFSVVFAALFLQVVFANPHFGYSAPLVLLSAAVWAGVFLGLWLLTGRFAPVLQRREKWLLAAFFVLQALVQLFMYRQVGAYPTMDFERVFTGAVNFSVNGFIEEPYLDYFYKYPNNMPLTILLQFVFRAFHRLGYSNFLVLGALLAAGCTLLTYLFVYLCVRRLLGVRQGFFALGVLFCCLPLQSFVSVFYTDVVSMPFIPFAFYCYLRLRDAATWKGRLLAGGLLALAVGFGAKLKYSVVLVFIAILADLLLRLEWKRLLALAAAFLLCFFAVGAVFDSFMYAHFLDETVAKDRATPFTAWIMMGLARDGAHDPNDNYLIWNWESAEEKKQAAADEIGRRLSGFTPLTFVQFLNQKSLRSFGSGNLDAPRVVGDSPMRQTGLIELVAGGGKHNQGYDTFTQGYHVLLFGLVTVGAVFAARRRNYAAFVPYLAIFGLWMFLLLWESGQRYLLNYYGMYIIAATFAAGQLAHSLRGGPRAVAARWRGGKMPAPPTPK